MDIYHNVDDIVIKPLVKLLFEKATSQYLFRKVPIPKKFEEMEEKDQK